MCLDPNQKTSFILPSVSGDWATCQKVAFVAELDLKLSAVIRTWNTATFVGDSGTNKSTPGCRRHSSIGAYDLGTRTRRHGYRLADMNIVCQSRRNIPNQKNALL